MLLLRSDFTVYLRAQMSPVLDPRRPPPDGYYAANLRVVINTVCDQYQDLLTAEEASFARVLLDLSEDGLRLFARLQARTRSLIRHDSLVYADIHDVPQALTELAEANLIAINIADDVVELLHLLRVAELRETFAHETVRGRKAELIEAIQAQFDEDTIKTRTRECQPWLQLSASETFNVFRLLFFGNTAQNMDEFVIRDLGVTRFESYSMDPAFRLFNDRRAIERYQELIGLAESVDVLGKEVTPADANVILEAISAKDDDRVFELRRSRILNVLGRNLERTDELDLARYCYSHSTLHPARERTMRILRTQGKDEAVERVRAEIFDAPRSLEEQLFAERFARPKTAATAIRTRTSVAPLESEFRIEATAIQILAEENCQAWHLENVLPNALFGLAYWEWLFASVRGAFVNPFQAAPQDLYWREFFEVRQVLCENPLANPSTLKQRMCATAKAKRGITNQLVAWSVVTPELLQTILDAISTEQLLRLLSIMTADLRQYRGGFPDLTVIDRSGDIAFVEVKGPGDQLRPNQRLWIEQLMQAQFNVYVWRFR